MRLSIFAAAVIAVPVLPVLAVLTFGNNSVSTNTDYNLDGTAISNFNFGASLGNGNITIGGESETGVLTFGQSNLSNTINIGSANTDTQEVQTINIGAGTPAGDGEAEVNIGNTNSGSLVNISAGTGSVTVNSDTLNLDDPNDLSTSINSPEDLHINANSDAGQIFMEGGMTSRMNAYDAAAESVSLSASASGSLVTFSQDSSTATITLPASPAAGTHYKIMLVSTGSADTAIQSGDSSTFEGLIIEPNVDNGDVINSPAVAVNFVGNLATKGSYVDVTYTGAFWQITGVTGVEGGIIEPVGP